MKKVWDYLWPVLLCVGVGVTAGFFQLKGQIANA